MSTKKEYPPMVGDTVVCQYIREMAGLYKVVGVSYTYGTDSYVGTVDLVSMGGSKAVTLDIQDIKILMFDSEARESFHFGEEPDVVY